MMLIGKGIEERGSELSRHKHISRNFNMLVALNNTVKYGISLKEQGESG
jgi:hypothetical protein